MVYKDEKGHFTSKENDGGPCHHGTVKYNDKSSFYEAYDKRGKRVGGDFSTDRDAYEYLDSNNDDYEDDVFTDKKKYDDALNQVENKALREVYRHAFLNENVETGLREQYRGFKDKWISDKFDPQDDADYEEAEGYFEDLFGDEDEFVEVGVEFKRQIDKGIIKNPNDDDGRGVSGQLEKAGFKNIKIIDNKTLIFEGPDAKEGWMIKENRDLGFDVYDSEGNMVIEDIDANRENVATRILQYEQNK